VKQQLQRQQEQQQQDQQAVASEKYSKQQYSNSGRSDSYDRPVNVRNQNTNHRRSNTERSRGSPRRSTNNAQNNSDDVMFSVMATQPPPPPNRSFKSTSSKFTTLSNDLHGNPSWFSGEAYQPNPEYNKSNNANMNAAGRNDNEYNNNPGELYVGMYVDKNNDDSTVSTMSTMSTSRTNLSHPSTVSSNKSERSNQSTSSRDKNSNKSRSSSKASDDVKDVTTIIPQTDEVTVVYTSIQGSQSLWKSCPDDMIEAHDVYDIILRRCFEDHNGYEISSTDDESSLFQLVFQNTIDAVAFALDVQIKLYESTSWPEGIMNQDDAKYEPALKFRGLRVRIGMHCGSLGTQTNRSTGRSEYEYVDEVVDIAEALQGLCHGGQILTTSELWNSVCGTIEGTGKSLNKPQVMDLGEHFLFEVQSPNNDGSMKKVSKRVLQLVPHGISFDFEAARGRIVNESSKVTIKNAENVRGRLFPPIVSKKQLSTSFLNAPYRNGRVTLCIVKAVGINEMDPNNNSAYNLKILSKHVKKQLLTLKPPGYECNAENGQWLIAFDCMMNGVTFGLQLKSSLRELPSLGDINNDSLFKVAIITGSFESMSPNSKTGKAEYTGSIVERTNLVATNCEVGQICVGIQDGAADPPDFGISVKVELCHQIKVPGMKNSLAVFSCKKRNIDMPYA